MKLWGLTVYKSSSLQTSPEEPFAPDEHATMPSSDLENMKQVEERESTTATDHTHVGRVQTSSGLKEN
jgi:hypothetical protein